MMIDEFVAVVRVKAFDGERERMFNMLNLGEDSGFAFAPRGALFSPTGSDVCKIGCYGIDTVNGVAAMSDSIGFDEAGDGFIPLVGLDGDLVSQEGAGFGGGAASFFVVDAAGAEDAVDGGRGDAR